jgi:hypothetical protein
MAKHKRKHSRRHGRGVGSVITVRRLNGLGDLKNPNTIMGAALPVVLGGIVTIATTIGVRKYLTPSSDLQKTLHDNAAVVGIGAGGLVSLGLWLMSSQPAGVASLLTSVVTGVGFIVLEKSGSAVAGPGVGAVVPEYSQLGAIVMEPQASRGYGAGPLGRGVGSYGETVNLQGVKPQVFGTMNFQN